MNDLPDLRASRRWYGWVIAAGVSFALWSVVVAAAWLLCVSLS